MRLGDVCESVSQTFRKQQDKVILINTSDVLDGKVTNHEYVLNENLRGQFKKSFRRNDILYSEIRPKNRRFAYVDFDASDYIASTKLMVIRANDKVLPQFLFQVLKSDEIIEQLQLLAETRSGTFPQITFSELAALDVCIPSITEQQEIATTLTVMDDKIVNNTTINHHLSGSMSETDSSPDIRRGSKESRVA
jgi:type I restriction enzyme S subunit